MILSAKVEYASIAILELANYFESGEPMRLREIAESQRIPPAFLVQIMLQLKAAGLVESTRGASGGYRLARDPGRITLAEVKGIMEGPSSELGSNIDPPTAASRLLLETWREADSAAREPLERITFAELAERCQDVTREMYYI